MSRFFRHEPLPTPLHVDTSSSSTSRQGCVRAEEKDATEWIEATAEEEKNREKKFLSTMTAVPSDLYSMWKESGQISRSFGRRNGKKNNARLNEKVISKFYNPVAGRPLAISRNDPAEITVNMGYSNFNAFSTSTAVITVLGFNFSLSLFSEANSYLSVFDQYRIDYFEAWLEPRQSQSITTANTGTIVSAVDVDDSSVPLTYNQVEDHQSAIASSTYAGHYHAWVPHIALASYSGAFTSYANVPAIWLDSGSPAVQHYGLKVATSATGAVETFSLVVRARVSFKNPGL